MLLQTGFISVINRKSQLSCYLVTSYVKCDQFWSKTPDRDKTGTFREIDREIYIYWSYLSKSLSLLILRRPNLLDKKGRFGQKSLESMPSVQNDQPEATCCPITRGTSKPSPDGLPFHAFQMPIPRTKRGLARVVEAVQAAGIAKPGWRLVPSFRLPICPWLF